ncbi:ABC transporter ATP-binding protein [Microbispora sp. H10836]|uniref:ABC transporter ATP-binding protein n=1 Tax=Microbispora sp. H10836 TaxID=2729106 RepID=UPI0014730928|nr:ABC transporter ATP-binding protein [Microbispora sp. H10836]
MNEKKPLLEVSNVSLRFGGVTALDGISFAVEHGEFFAIIGPNGAGKTSLLNVLNGFYRPQQGEVALDGHSLIGRRPSTIASLGVARTFQNLALFDELTVLENVVLGRHHLMRSGILSGAFWWGRARKEEYAARRECLPLLEMTGLDGIAGRPVRDLPYGVKKRVELARALALKPRLLLLDEPVAGMNATESNELASWVQTAQRQLDLTVVMIEHDMALVRRVADRALVIDFGQVVCLEAPDLAMRDPRVVRAYLGGTDDALVHAAVRGDSRSPNPQEGPQ